MLPSSWDFLRTNAIAEAEARCMPGTRQELMKEQLLIFYQSPAVPIGGSVAPPSAPTLGLLGDTVWKPLTKILGWQ